MKNKKCYLYAIVGVLGVGLIRGGVFFGLKHSNTKKNIENTSKKQIASQTVSAKDYEEIYSYIQEGEDSVSTYAREMTASESDSQTNIRTQGVGEGDCVQSDGKNLYIKSRDKIQIVNIKSNKMEHIATITPTGDNYLTEIYLKDNRLICLYNSTKQVGDTWETGRSQMHTEAEVFDVSNPSEPKSLGKATQSGSFFTMREVDGYVYIFSTFQAMYGSARDDISTYVPYVQGEALESSRIVLPAGKTGNAYTVVSAFSLDNPKEKTDSIAFLGSSGGCYISKENIYLYDTLYGEEENQVSQTTIRKASYKDGILESIGNTTIAGTVFDSFCMDEYEGNLRVVTTLEQDNGIMPLNEVEASEGDTSEEPVENPEISNTLYILDNGLNEIAQINEVANGEKIYAARFLEEIGYFVTYKAIDPLFSVDLSNPQEPKILGELKVLGFSEYLHSFGEGRLLGIGIDTDETGTASDGVKISMFDTSNPKKVQELQKKVLEGAYSTDVSYNYKAAFVDVERSLVGFPVYEDYPMYYLYTYDEENGFTEILKRELGSYTEARGVVAGDKFYIVTDATIEAYEQDTMKKVADLVL